MANDKINELGVQVQERCRPTAEEIKQNRRIKTVRGHGRTTESFRQIISSACAAFGSILFPKGYMLCLQRIQQRLLFQFMHSICILKKKKK